MLRVLTSLRLTVACLAFSMVLVFIGTIRQVDEGLYIAQDRYFKSFLVWWSPSPGLSIPVFPGGYTVGLVLLANLLAAHAKRFKPSRRKIGIFLIHSGLILLLLGQLSTDLLSRESAWRFEEGEVKNYSVDFRKNELALVESLGDRDRIHSVPESMLRKGALIKDPALPYGIRVLDYWPNARLYERPVEGSLDTRADSGPASRYQVEPLPPVTEMDLRDNPCAVVELIHGDHPAGAWLVSTLLKPQTVEHGDASLELSLRYRRYYEPFTLTLLKATHEKYRGTERPKNFSSEVLIRNPESGENRKVLIYMNHPLRYQGLTFYQHQMAADEAMLQQGMVPTSTLQVVRNPAWLTPYLACLLVGAGLLIQFSYHLFGFLRKHKPGKR